LKNRVFYFALVVSLGGFLFGFDTAVISGAEQAIQVLWGLDVFSHGLTVSIALVGTVLGAFFGGIPSDTYGRKYTLIGIGILYFISALGSAITTDWYAFLFFRWLGGLGVGASSIAAPLYISEIAPAHLRGRLVAMFQFNIVLGILIAFLSNYLIADLGGVNMWRWMLGVEIVPAFVFIVLMFTVPHSPRWLIIKLGKLEGAKKIFQMTGEKDIESKINEIQQSSVLQAKGKIRYWDYKKPIFLAVTLAIFNQVSGINAIIYYAPRIFEMAGLGKSSALLSSVGIGVINFMFTLLAIVFIDKLGRRLLMHIGSFGLIGTLSMVAYSFHVGPDRMTSVPIYLFIYIAFFAFSQGAVIWVFISEIFPNDVRAFGQSVGSFTHWIMAACIAAIFPALTAQIGPANTFMLFACMMVLQWVFVFLYMPETKGRSLEDLGKTL
jgi:MFS transporter, SP family, arabinose:H+ symporter